MAKTTLSVEPAGLLTDFDGTLAPIVSDPAQARPVDGVADALTALAARLAVVGIVTGRAALDARRLLGAEGVLVVGNHGTEWLEPGATAPDSALDAAVVRAGLTAALGRLPVLDGVPVEDKGLSASVHYRNAADPEAARAAVLEALGDVGPDGLELRHGRMSVELRPLAAADKGSAARAIIERHGLRGLVVLGDDVTDLDMFAAAADLRAAGRLRAAIFGVGGGGGEVPPAVGEAADVTLAGPEEAARLLAGLR